MTSIQFRCTLRSLNCCCTTVETFSRKQLLLSPHVLATCFSLRKNSLLERKFTKTWGAQAPWGLGFRGNHLGNIAVCRQLGWFSTQRPPGLLYMFTLPLLLAKVASQQSNYIIFHLQPSKLGLSGFKLPQKTSNLSFHSLRLGLFAMATNIRIIYIYMYPPKLPETTWGNLF